VNRLFRVIALTLLCLLVAAPAVQAAPRTPFVGAWKSIDTDGSTQYLAVSGGTTVHVTWVDLYGSICANNGAPTTVFSGSLRGTVAGDTLTATWTRTRCGPVSFSWLLGTTATWTYDAHDDVIFDGSVTWTRR
jgi:hypothetical protein